MANVVGMTQMNPPMKDLCEKLSVSIICALTVLCLIVPRMTPILRNRHERVQEASINLIGGIGIYHSSYCNRTVADQCVQPIAVPSPFPPVNGCISVSNFSTS
jgi:hypothetical protein